MTAAIAISAETIDSVDVAAYRVPTDAPESDGTLEWDATTMIVVEICAGDRTGLGWTYAPAATARVVREEFAGLLLDRDPMQIEGLWRAMVVKVRNGGREGISATAVSAVDAALWDLKAKRLDVSLASLLGTVREEVPIYGSGGFTSYDDRRLREQLAGWTEQGIPRVKMKVGRDADRDVARVAAAREAIGPEAELFVDANGAWSRKEALRFAEAFADYGVRWFEEPVDSRDLEGLRLLRDRAPVSIDIASGEYGYEGSYFRRMLAAGAVDVLQADATRCGGVTGYLQVAALCDAYQMPLSAHCAPALHVALGCATFRTRHLEFFHDHMRIERMFFDGVPEPVDGTLRPDLARPGFGYDFRRQDAERYAIR